LEAERNNKEVSKGKSGRRGGTAPVKRSKMLEGGIFGTIELRKKYVREKEGRTKRTMPSSNNKNFARGGVNN